MAQDPNGGTKDKSGDHAEITSLTGSGSERRTSARLPMEMWVEELTDASQVFRRAGNLSRGGLYLDQTIPLPIGTRVSLKFTLPDDKVPVTVFAETVSIRGDVALGMGVKFVEVPPEVQARIDAYVKRVHTPVPT
jgi:type IV pilus assembly protein PilZ